MVKIYQRIARWFNNLFKREVKRAPKTVNRKHTNQCLTEEQVKSIFKDAEPNTVKEFTETFNKYCQTFQINTPKRIRIFLAQIYAEVGPRLKPVREGLNYSTTALRRLFKYYRDRPNEAYLDGRNSNHKANQRNIANKAYANRMGNGNAQSGDGWRYRGGGYIQLTGRDNYKSIASILTIMLGEEYTVQRVINEIETVHMALLTAMAFWAREKIYECKTVDCATKKVNPYTPTYGERKKYYAMVSKIVK